MSLVVHQAVFLLVLAPYFDLLIHHLLIVVLLEFEAKAVFHYHELLVVHTLLTLLKFMVILLNAVDALKCLKCHLVLAIVRCFQKDTSSRTFITLELLLRHLFLLIYVSFCLYTEVLCLQLSTVAAFAVMLFLLGNSFLLLEQLGHIHLLLHFNCLLEAVHVLNVLGVEGVVHEDVVFVGGAFITLVLLLRLHLVLLFKALLQDLVLLLHFKDLAVVNVHLVVNAKLLCVVILVFQLGNCSFHGQAVVNYAAGLVLGALRNAHVTDGLSKLSLGFGNFDLVVFI